MKFENVKYLVVLFSSLLLSLASNSVRADITVNTISFNPFVELRSGPGNGYPVFNVIENGERVEVVGRRADWFKVRAPNQSDGWIRVSDLYKAIYSPLDAQRHIQKFNDSRRFEAAIGTGLLSGDWFYETSFGYRVWKNFSVRGSAAKAIGDYSSSTIFGINAIARVFTLSNFSSFVAANSSYMVNVPRSTLVKRDVSDFVVFGYGAGVEWRFYSNLNWYAAIKLQNGQSNQAGGRQFIESQTGLSAFF